MAFRTTHFTGRVHLPKLGRRRRTPKNLVLGVEQFPATTEEQTMDGSIIAMIFAVLHILWVLPTTYFLTIIVLNR